MAAPTATGVEGAFAEVLDVDEEAAEADGADPFEDAADEPGTDVLADADPIGPTGGVVTGLAASPDCAGAGLAPVDDAAGSPPFGSEVGLP